MSQQAFSTCVSNLALHYRLRYKQQTPLNPHIVIQHWRLTCVLFRGPVIQCHSHQDY